jgi:hypothetical protein
MGYADYTRGTGTTGTMMIRVADAAGQNGVITANHIQFWLNAGQGATNVGSAPWSGYVNGVGVGGNFSYPSGNPWVLIAEYYVGYTQDVRFSIGATGTQGLGGPTDFWVTVNRATVPPAPTPWCISPNPNQITPTTLRAQFCSQGDGGSAITSWAIQIATNPSFTNAFTAASTGTTTFTDLVPGTTYYFRARGQNAIGVSAWSDTWSGTTTNPGPPGITSVTPSATGTSATVVLTAPSGFTVSSYNIQNRTPGGSWTTVATGSANPSQVVSGLTPGQTYEWRASAVVQGYTTAVGNVVSATQPQPNASPGSFWNGDTPDTPTTNYTWTGAAGASTSQAQTLTGGAVGWLSGPEAVSKGSGGTAVQYQVNGGLEPNGNGGDWSALYVMLTGATGNGFRGGTDGVDGYAVVTEGGQYMGSIHVEPNRTRVLAAMWVWYNGAGVEIGTTLGAPVSVGAGATARLTVLGTAPVGAVRGAVVFTDPAGSSMMAAGDTIRADADMASTGILYPYFDGDTPDSTQFIYSWVGAADSSPSQREAIPQDEQNPLLDPNCPPLPQPPAPPVIEDDCIDPIGSWRRRLFAIDGSAIPDSLSAVPTVTLETFGQTESQVRLRWYRNPDCLPPLSVDTSQWEYEQIISFIPANTVITLDGVSERVWASVAGADPIPADSLLYGTNGVPATWPTLSCEGCWLISLDTDLASNVSNLLPSASLTVRE